MKCELWYSARERSGVLLRQGDTASVELKSPDAQVIWTVDAKEYAVAADLCSALLHWGNRESGETQATIRLTMAFYLNRQGEQCHISVPGWVGRNLALLPGSEDVYFGLIDFLSLVVPERGRILGYAYIERPSLVAFDGPALVIQAMKPLVLTVVNLRSTDGTEELAQEFYGRFQDSQEISRMVGERLGPQMSDWTIVQAQIHEHPKPP